MPNICLRGCIKAISRWSHHLLLNNELTGGNQRHRGEENQSSIHLIGEIRWFVLALWENPANMSLKVLSRHLHPMAYPGHRAGVTTGSSTQPGESVQLLTPRNTLNYYDQKQMRSHHCHTRMHRMQNSNCCWKRSPGVSRYTTTKNRRNNPERLELMKFCPQLNRMTHREIK